MTVGETPFTHSPDQLGPYVLPTSKELNMIFQFQLMDIDAPHSGGSDAEPFKHNSLVWTEWKLGEMKTVVQRWQGYKRDEGYWNAYVWLRFLLICFVDTSVCSQRFYRKSRSGKISFPLRQRFGRVAHHLCPNARHLPSYSNRHVVRLSRG